MFAKFTNVTAAVKIKKYLRRKGIVSDIVQAPVKLRKEGCVYALKFSINDMDAVNEAANELGLLVQEYYDETKKKEE